MRPIIIGSGMGGLCTGLILKKNGFNPIVFEKDNHYGGSFWSYKLKGYTIDTGAHMLTRGKSGELPTLMKKYIDPNIFEKKFVAQKHYRFYIHDKGAEVPGNLSSLLKFDLLQMKDRISFLKMFVDFLRLGRAGTEKYPNMKSYDYVKKYVTSRDLLILLNAFSWMSTGCSIKEGALSRFVDTFVRDKKMTGKYILKHITPTSNATEGDWYPKGGLKKVPEYFIKQGLDVRLCKKVDKIIIKNNQVVGVKIGKKIMKTDMVIYDGLVKNLNKMLIGGKYTGKLPKEDEYASVTIWLGFKKKIADWNRESRVYCDPNLESPHWAVFFTDFDQTLAPKGHQLFGMSAITHGDTKKLVSKMEKTLDKMLPGYKKHLDMKHVQIWRAEKTLQKAHNSMWNLPEQKTNIKGLYVVGTDTKGYGSGGTLCADSAMRCWHYIRKDYKV
ncbi:MAG: FAD-dependent oxidoreductase [Candidatus Aenigmarchaeota archaeon]|nr:FAD-dependent oxidoreductase [Candidatus Aenigmarchaeota archaeon]